MEERGGAGGAAQPAGAKESSASTGAATEVGAGRSKKHRRTYWEPCAEGKEARRQWAPAFEAKVKGNEEAADAYRDKLPKRQSTRERAWVLGEHYNMTKGDRESRIWMTMDAMHEQLRWYRSQELRVEIPPALFKCGQAVLQWWASWMKDAPETPSHYNKKSRPAWFSAEVASYCGYGHIKYAGQTMLAHQYHVY